MTGDDGYDPERLVCDGDGHIPHPTKGCANVHEPHFWCFTCTGCEQCEPEPEPIRPRNPELLIDVLAPGWEDRP